MTKIAEVVGYMFDAWNAPDETAIRAAAEQALTFDIEFDDPDYSIKGFDAWVAMAASFRAKFPGARPHIASGIDTYRNRARYAWAVDFIDGACLEGLDTITVHPLSGKINRINSFIGHLPVIQHSHPSEIIIADPAKRWLYE
jgi:hypothetical protein